MSKDDKVIGYLTPADMVALMNETGMIAVQESTIAAGQPAIHAAIKVINAQTGEQLPGGLPFTVVMFKTAREPGYSNIAIGTVIPAAELGVALPHDYFNFANQRYRFARVFPLDDRAFVIQMDLFLHNATREYVKFSFGLWAALFSQVLFELMGRGGESLHAAAQAFAAARTELAQQFVETTIASDEPAADETAVVEAPIETVAEVAPEAMAELPEPVAVTEAAEAPVEAEAEAVIAADVAPELDAKADTEVKADAEVKPEAEVAVEEPAEAAPEPAQTAEAVTEAKKVESV